MKKFVCAAFLAFSVAPALGQEAPTFDWKLRYAAGQKWSQTFQTRSTITQVLTPQKGPQQKLDMQTTQTFRMDNEVLSVTPRAFRVKMTYRDFNTILNAKVNGKAMAIPAAAQNATKPITDAMRGLSFSFDQDPNGKISKISGLDEWSRRMKAAFKKSGVPAVGLEFASSPKAMRDLMMKNANVALPSGPLAIGRGYSYALDTPAGFPVAFSIYGSRILKNLDEKTATFDETATFSSDGVPQAVPGSPKTQMALILTGTQSGKTEVNVATGLMTRTDLLQRMNGTIRISEAGKAVMNSRLWAKNETTMTTK